MSQASYKPEKGTEDLVHVRVTEKSGQKLKEPAVEQYNPRVYANVTKLAGFKAEVLYEPKGAAASEGEPSPEGTELPTDKKGWYDLYTQHQTEKGEDLKEYDDITVSAIRELLGK